MAQTYGIAIIPWSPLAGGMLTGKYTKGEAPPSDSRLERNKMLRERLTEHAFDVIDLLKPLAEDKSCSLSQFSLAWCSQQPGITSPIIGPRTMEQLEDNLKATDVEISDEDRKEIDKIFSPGNFLADYYQADFGPHQYRW